MIYKKYLDKIKNINGLSKFDAVRAYILQNNQRTVNCGKYNNLLSRAIYRIFGENFMFRKIVSYEPLEEINGQTYYLEFKDNWFPEYSEKEDNVQTDNFETGIKVAIESKIVPNQVIPLKIELPADLSTDSDEGREIEGAFFTQLENEVNFEIVNNINDLAEEFNFDFDTARGDTIKEKYESLYVKVVEVSNIIHKKTLRGGANWILTHPKVADIFESTGWWPEIEPSEEFKKTLGFRYRGTVNARWKLYYNWNMPENEMLMGYNGDSYMDSGLIYSSYIPFTIDGTKISLNQGRLTTESAHYAKIKIKNFMR